MKSQKKTHFLNPFAKAGATLLAESGPELGFEIPVHMTFPPVGSPEALTVLTPTFRNVSVIVIVTVNRAKSLVLNSRTPNRY